MSPPPTWPTFGANEWLVEEMYQHYVRDPDSVDSSWWSFFSGHEPAGRGGESGGDGGRTGSPQPGQPDRAIPTRSATEAGPGPNGGPQLQEQAEAAGKRQEPGSDGQVRLRGGAARTATNMQASLSVPTATSVRTIPAKLLIDNRVVINNHLRRARGGKVSFTHLIGYAVLRALQDFPELNHGYAEQDGQPVLIQPEHVNLGLAVDVARADGGRQLLVPSIKAAETLDFVQFWRTHDELVHKAHEGRLSPDDFTGTTISLTNPGIFGTEHSVPRLMPGQGCIVGIGTMEYPAEYQGASDETLARLAVSKVLPLTCTYDHRVIQGAQSGEFLRRIHQLLLGADDFYGEIFRVLRLPYEPIKWQTDIVASHEDEVAKPARVLELIHAYRVRGHLMADTDPLEYKQREHPDLDIQNHGLTLWDLDREFATGGFGSEPLMKLRDILGVLRDSYCRTVGVEYMHIQEPDERAWIQKRVERPYTKPSREEQLHVLHRLGAAEAFETFLQTKYVGQKRFSLEGGESVIPLLDAVLSAAAREGLDEAVIGMPHRGRLNVLANIIGKSYAQIFQEFQGHLDPRSAHGSGDVKYHLGAEGVFTRDGAEIPASLVANPSHLEAVDPVLEGVVRAKQDIIDTGEFSVLPILLHGDAAFTGQGVVAETLNLSQLRGYRTGGTVHVVINNQVGFTTSPRAGRSSFYATDVARMIQSPVFHVNGDDAEACVRVAQLAYAYRQAFHKDVVIDLVCYRRRGHNEADNPSFTQPVMYDRIDAKRSVRELAAEALVDRGDITREEADQALQEYRAQLERAFTETREADERSTDPGSLTRPEPHQPPAPSHADVPTAISDEALKRVVDTQLNLPEGFSPHPRLTPQLQRRGRMVAEDQIDWALGETLAFGSLLLDGHPVRLAGQDSRRGTFGQRHAVVVDRNTGEEHIPLKQLDSGQVKFYAYDSLLSEFAATGFEYGYSVVRPDALVCWEAQFGDFANGAQVVIDEFIASGEAKWAQQSGVVLLLPHGYEGQGPDHSSARIERFLALCAQDNMVVAVPSKPANYFHLLRWHVMSGRRKPLIVLTPKSLLRLKAASSSTADFTGGQFLPVYGDVGGPPAEQVRRVALCTGKVYYDLAQAREQRGRGDTAILRVERLYPLPVAELRDALAGFPNAGEVVWVQEEPANMGAWPCMAGRLPAQLGGRTLRAVSRPESAAPATGFPSVHESEQRAIVEQLFPETG